MLIISNISNKLIRTFSNYLDYAEMKKYTYNSFSSQNKEPNKIKNNIKHKMIQKYYIITIVFFLCLLGIYVHPYTNNLSNKNINTRNLSDIRSEEDEKQNEAVGGEIGLTWGHNSLDDPDFQVLVDKWSDFEKRVSSEWYEIERMEINQLKNTLLAAWISAILLTTVPDEHYVIFNNWFQMSLTLSHQRILKNEEDNKTLEYLMKKLKYKALNGQIKNWHIEVYDYWRHIVQMKISKNKEWATYNNEICNTWVKSLFN
ncbi:putative exported protein [Plasmodium reichenowi]|uniref:Putative exported protein n=1 Tax=Plasmodium reichenowi TaxID=5854 RepID=A0A151LTL4_PLARE|nr:putative exported protein [Plasmodium reichenowi]KYO02519.1 putative exported protein [Plasmodium reichenowi]